MYIPQLITVIGLYPNYGFFSMAKLEFKNQQKSTIWHFPSSPIKMVPLLQNSVYSMLNPWLTMGKPGNGGFSEVQSRHRSSAAGSRRAPKRSGWSTEGVGPGCGSCGEPVNPSFVDHFPKNHAMSMNMFIGKRVNQMIVSNAI